MVNFFKGKRCLIIKGKNVKRFIKKLNNLGVELLKIDYINDNEINVLIYKDDVEKVIGFNYFYEIIVSDDYGVLKIQKKLNELKFFVFSLFCTTIIFFVLINMVFDVEVLHNDKDLRNLIISELEKDGISKYHFKKSFDDVQKIRKKIEKKYSSKIEWIEIEENGVKYIVHVEERKINKEEDDGGYRNLVAKKSGVIKKIINNAGESLVQKDTYVNKGDVLISGEIHLNDEVKGMVSAGGCVYAEVWYTIKTEYPYIKYEEVSIGEKKKKLVLNLFDKKYVIGGDKNNYKSIFEKNLIKSNLLPLSLSFEEMEKIHIIDEVLTYDEALIKAEEKLFNEVEGKLGEKEYIIFSKKLKSKLKNSKIELEMFFAVYEDITEFERIGD